MSDQIKAIMAQIFGVSAESIISTSSPESIPQWDSLKHMQLIMALEDELEMQFDDEMIPGLLSYEAIEKAVQEVRSQ
jgi:acyl carrier protein